MPHCTYLERRARQKVHHRLHGAKGSGQKVKTFKFANGNCSQQAAYSVAFVPTVANYIVV